MNNLRIKTQKAFTLIELLVVIAIIAVLMVGVLVVINPFEQIGSANNVKRGNDLNQITSAIQQNMIDNRTSFICAGGPLPTDCEAPKTMGSGAGQYDICDCLVDVYLAVMPFDPTAEDAKYVDCTDYDTQYKICEGSIRLSAPHTQGSASIVTASVSGSITVTIPSCENEGEIKCAPKKQCSGGSWVDMVDTPGSSYCSNCNHCLDDVQNCGESGTDCGGGDQGCSACAGTCPDGTCDTGENCPADSADCTDNVCYDPTCINGCAQDPVASGVQDPGECDNSTGCGSPPCECNGSGSCVIISPTCPDGICDIGESCPADSTNCTDNVCYDPTCDNGCGEDPVASGVQDPGECDGCYQCDGSGTCIESSLTWIGSSKTECDCSSEGGTIYDTGSGTICRITGADINCPATWLQAGSWQKYSAASWDGDDCGLHTSSGSTTFSDTQSTCKSLSATPNCSGCGTCSQSTNRWHWQVFCVSPPHALCDISTTNDCSTDRTEIGCY